MFGFKSNSGYIGQSRSVRSQNAINNSIIPLSLFNTSSINDFKLNSEETYHNNIFKLPVTIWKFAAELNGTNIYHHTGKYYSITYHYDLRDVAEYLDEHYQTIRNDYKKFRQQKYKMVQVGVIHVKLWKKARYYNNGGQSHRYFKYDGYKTIYGYIKNGKLIPYSSAKYATYNLMASKVEDFDVMDNIHDFINHMYVNEDKKIDKKAFIRFLHDCKMDCNAMPNASDKDEMDTSHKLDLKVRRINSKIQYRYNKQNPTALHLRKLVNQRQYNDFLTTMLSQYNNINKHCLIEETRSHVYFDDVFHMPKHLINWLTLQTK